jgi:hypothetical protein
MTDQRSKASRSVRLGACAAAVLLAACGCVKSPRDQIFDACESAVKHKVKPKSVEFSLERLTVTHVVGNHATMLGSAQVEGAKRHPFSCTAVHNNGHWKAFHLTGVSG